MSNIEPSDILDLPPWNGSQPSGSAVSVLPTNLKSIAPWKKSQNVALTSRGITKSSRTPNLYTKPTSVINPQIDQLWGGMFDPNAVTPYADYYFTGQDVQIAIDGCTEAPYDDMPISEFTFTVDQNKMPIYGYASYTYDAMAIGSRIIRGKFCVATRSPDFMMQALALAAKNRSNNLSSIATGYNPPLAEDDQNLLTYWGNNSDPSLTEENYNMFSTHPPFTLVIQYGIQDVSTVTTAAYNQKVAQLQALEVQRGGDQMVLDINDRLVQPDPSNPQYMTFILDTCQIEAMSTRYVAGTSRPLEEEYLFTARDIIYPPPAVSSASLF